MPGGQARPGTEVPGYFRDVPLGRENWVSGLDRRPWIVSTTDDEEAKTQSNTNGHYKNTKNDLVYLAVKISPKKRSIAPMLRFSAS